MPLRNGLAASFRPEEPVLFLIDHPLYILTHLNNHDPLDVVATTIALTQVTTTATSSGIYGGDPDEAAHLASPQPA